MRSHHDILIAAERGLASGHTFLTSLMTEIGVERAGTPGFRELDQVMTERVSDAFAELYPDHVGVGLPHAVRRGIRALGLTGAEVSAAVARRAVENCPA
ncbi:hypothetical protein [Methylobacterium aquaticum]|uniref:Uncharacterized protein n=1 Tax=Methylobacterium aquaticum TaxID=270351 RepID=A0A0C6FTC3_9HYPH|nr:hypothetical protein [Methylobacterium aquaticum]BAQ50332.1 hypothetical protein Maq22A_3p50410 [Methylobacterium aquaticum]